jgi:hypothetical protein
VHLLSKYNASLIAPEIATFSQSDETVSKQEGVAAFNC